MPHQPQVYSGTEVAACLTQDGFSPLSRRSSVFIQAACLSVSIGNQIEARALMLAC